MDRWIVQVVCVHFGEDLSGERLPLSGGSARRITGGCKSVRTIWTVVSWKMSPPALAGDSTEKLWANHHLWGTSHTPIKTQHTHWPQTNLHCCVVTCVCSHCSVPHAAVLEDTQEQTDQRSLKGIHEGVEDHLGFWGERMFKKWNFSYAAEAMLWRTFKISLAHVPQTLCTSSTMMSPTSLVLQNPPSSSPTPPRNRQNQGGGGLMAFTSKVKVASSSPSKCVTVAVQSGALLLFKWQKPDWANCILRKRKTTFWAGLAPGSEQLQSARVRVTRRCERN